jgi:VWFA-related protein
MRGIFVTLLTAILLLAQSPQGPASADSKAPPKFSVTAQLVMIGVNAKDKDGKPIADLQAADFVVTEDGKKQRLASCEYQHIDNSFLEALSTTPAEHTDKPPVSPSVAPSRPAELRYKDRRLLVLYFDMTAMPLEDQLRAQESALRFVRTEMTSADTVSVMSFTSQLKLLQDFTADRDLIVKAINSLVAGEGSDLTTTANDASATGAAYTADDSEFNIFNADRKLVALQSAIKSLGALPEKKGLLYFSSGFTKSGVENEAQMRATTNAAIRNNVALFPVDSRGLSATALFGDSSKSPASASAMLNNSGSAALGKLQASQESLHTLAADTGGKELINTNDLAAGIVQAQKEINDYYILTYQSTNQALDGSFRRVKVELAERNKTAHLDYRSGYFAGKDFKQFTATDRENRLQEALLLGDPITDLPVALELNYFRLAQDRYFVPLEAKIPGSEIDLARHGDMESARLDFVGQVSDSKGKVVKQVRDNLEVRLKGVTAAELASKNLAYDAGFELPPGVYTVKFLARENVTGRIGTFETKLNIPDLSAEMSWLPISSVVLSSQIEAQSAAVAAVNQDKKIMADHPLVMNGQKIVPSVTRAFRRAQTLHVYLEAFEAEAPRSLETTVSFYRGATKVFETPMDISKQAFKASAKVQPINLSIPLAPLEPGRYVCQVSVIDAHSQKVAFWRAPVAVLP